MQTHTHVHRVCPIFLAYLTLRERVFTEGRSFDVVAFFQKRKSYSLYPVSYNIKYVRLTM